MRPFDPRLLRSARATRRYLVVAVAVGVATAVVVLAQAWLLALLVDAGFVHHKGPSQLRGPLLALAVVLFLRASLLWATEAAAARSSAQAKSELRSSLLEHAVDLGPGAISARGVADLTTLATRGVDALDGYFARYLPQVILSVLVPVAVLLVLVHSDLTSALIVAVTLPLIPIFMILIGSATQSRMNAQLGGLQRLAGHFLDVVSGLTTLKIFGRARSEEASVRETTDAYRVMTMRTLRVAFLSGLVLELLAMLSVALVAVSVGLRVVDGDLGFRTALFVLILAPEAYLPLRAVGASFHSSAEGVAAVEQVFAVLEEAPRPRGLRADVPDARSSALEFRGVSARYAGRSQPVLDEVSLTVQPGTIVALTGPSGAGKSTLLAVLLGFVPPSSGSVLIGGVDIAELDPDAWRSQLAWVPQRPYLFAGTLADNVRLGRPDASDQEVEDALDAAGLSGLVALADEGVHDRLGEHGAGLSAGERQRLALARAFLLDAPLLVLDEPTAALDAETEAEVVAAVERLARGRTVLLVAHRPALVALASQVVALELTVAPDDLLVTSA